MKRTYQPNTLWRKKNARLSWAHEDQRWSSCFKKKTC